MLTTCLQPSAMGRLTRPAPPPTSMTTSSGPTSEATAAVLGSSVAPWVEAEERRGGRPTVTRGALHACLLGGVGINPGGVVFCC